MKEMSSNKLMIAYTGTFIGAGFVSGKEIWQYFGNFGKIGLVGLIVSLTIQCILGILIIRLAGKTSIGEVDHLICKWDIKPVRAVFSGGEVLTLLGVVIVMTAGAGALLNRMLGLNYVLGCLIFTSVVCVFSFMDFSGMVKAFSITVPTLVASTFLISVYALIKYKFQFNFEIESVKNGLISNWFIAAVNFTTNNLFAAFGVIIPLGSLIKNKNVVVQGVTTAVLMLLILSMSVLLPQFVVEGVYQKELPMLEVSFILGEWLGYVYSVLLLFGMFGATLSSTLGIVNMGRQKVEFFNRKPAFIIIPLVTICFVLSLFGFGNLIGVIYPICGYIGLAAIIMIIIHYFIVLKEERTKK